MNIDGIKNALGDLLAKLPIERFRDPPPVVGVLRLDGVIGRSAGPGRQGLSLASHERAIAKLFGRKNLKAVALVINSPGGSPVQSALIAQRTGIWRRKRNCRWPVLRRRGVRWLLLACAETRFSPMPIPSSGPSRHFRRFRFPDLIERFGIERRVYATGQRKGMLDPFRTKKPKTSIACTNCTRTSLRISKPMSATAEAVG